MPEPYPSSTRLNVLIFFIALVVACSTFLQACGGAGAIKLTAPRLSITPSQASVPFGWTQQFSASISGSPTTNVLWAVNGVIGGTPSSGTINASGLYAAPVVPPVPAAASISATSMSDPNSTGAVLVNLTGLFVYVGNQLGGTISGYSIDSAGLLAPLASPLTTTGQQPYFIASTPDGKFLYATDNISNALSGYSVDSVTGALTPVGPPIAVGSGIRTFAIHPNGKYLYAVCTQCAGIYGFGINGDTGVLTALPGSPSPNAGSRPAAIALDPTGDFAFVPNNASHNVSVFGVNSTNGQLTPVGSPFAAGNAPQWASTDISGKYVYVLDDLFNTIYAYSVANAGALSPLSPPTIAGVSDPLSATTNPLGNILYAPNSASASVSVFSIDPTTGNLVPIAGSPFATDFGPAFFAFEPSGTYAYVTNEQAGTIWGFSVTKPAGALSRLPWSITPGKLPTSITVVTTHP